MKKAIVLLADGFEEVETVTPIDYLRRCGVDVCILAVEVEGDTGADEMFIDWIRHCNVRSKKNERIGGNLVVGAQNICIMSDGILSDETALSELSHADLLILPGGMAGATHIASNVHAQKLAESVVKSGGFLAGICASPVIALDAWHMLKNKRFTCHPSVLDKLTDTSAFYQAHEDVVQDEKLITSRGAGTAEAFSFALINALCGEEAVKNLASQICARNI